MPLSRERKRDEADFALTDSCRSGRSTPRTLRAFFFLDLLCEAARMSRDGVYALQNPLQTLQSFSNPYSPVRRQVIDSDGCVTGNRGPVSRE